MELRNKSIPTLIMVVTDGRSADDPKIPARQLQQIPNTWIFAAATGNPETVDRHEFHFLRSVNFLVTKKYEF